MTIQSLPRWAAALAVEHDCELLGTLNEDEGEVRLLVVWRDFAHPVELVVRAGGDAATVRTGAEIAALEGAASEHVVRLVHVDRAPAPRQGRRRTEVVTPPAFLVEHPPGGDLDALLRRRDRLRCGEAVTILISVEEGLRALHRSGWAHGALSAGVIGFRDDGCPVLSGLSGARALTPESLQADRRALLGVAERVVLSLARDDALRLLAAAQSAFGAADESALRRMLVAVAQPEAVQLAVQPADPVGADPAGERPRSSASAGADLLSTFLNGHPVAELVVRAKEWLVARKRLVGLALVPIVAAVVVLALVPASGGGPAPGETTPPPASTPASTPAATGTSSPTTPPVPGPSATPAPAAPAAPSSADDDPVVAATALLATRHACFVAVRPDPECLGACVEPGSALYRSEAAALGSADAAAHRDLGHVVLALDQRWGDAALIAVAPGPDRPPGANEPASLLMVRSEAGWLLREVYS